MLCLPAKIRNHLIDNLKDGTLDLEELAKLSSSEERQQVLQKFVGTAASEPMTALFEKKLLMKNQQEGFISFIRDAIGDRPKVQKDLISRVEKLGELLSPADEAKYYESLVSDKLGTRTSYEDAKTISELSKMFQDAKAKISSDLPDGSAPRLRYGAAKVELNNFMNELRLANEKESLKETLGKFKTNPVGTATEQASKLAGIAKGIKASLDDSALFRQGWKTLFTNPQIWAKNALQSFKDIAAQTGKSVNDNSILDGIKAEIYSRNNAVNGLYEAMKLDVGNLEEAFPSPLPERIPLFGRLYKASETAYTGFLYRMRADIADQMVEKATAAGVDLNIPLQARSIGRLVNSLTGRGDLAKFGISGEAEKTLNTLFFSPRQLTSSLDFLILHAQDEMSGFARKQAGLNMLKVLSGIASIMGIARAIDPKSVELDPRSADFGKIRVGNTRFDISGGMGSLVTLAARIMSQSSKSSTTHKITPINSGKFGSQTGMDVITNFTENKLSPVAALVKDLVNQKDFEGKPITVGGEASNTFAPLPISNAVEVIKDPKGANAALTIIADALGISTNTYGSPKK